MRPYGYNTSDEKGLSIKNDYGGSNGLLLMAVDDNYDFSFMDLSDYMISASET